jgi:hypothetical protein
VTSCSRVSPVNRAAAGDLAAAGRLGDAAVDGQFLQDQAHDPVIGVAGDRLEPGEDPVPDPLVAAPADRGGAAAAVRDGLVRAAETQDLDELFEDDPAADPGPVAAQRVSGVVDGAVGQQGGKLVPEGLQQP